VRLVVDWDGTCTVRDTLLMVVNAFGDPSLEPELDAALAAGTMTHAAVMDAEFASVHATLEEVVAFVVEHAELRPGFHQLFERHRPLVLSASFLETIEPVLAREGVDAEVVANSVAASPSGWVISHLSGAECAECRQQCKRRLLPAGPVTYVGDGYSDHCAALAADRVFARDGLAAYLSGLGVPYEPYETLHDVAVALA
jgi:2-hydroxy-3-keto-5-methylthiopentenyl-1-phosphate phosphatase